MLKNKKLSTIIEKLKNYGGLKDDAQVAELLQLSKTALSNHKQRDTIPFEALTAFCLKEHISIDWLLSDLGTPQNGGQKEIEELVAIPLYAATASAGAGSIAENDDIIDHCRFKIEWIKKTLHANPRKLALVRITGDSMEPTLRTGDVIMINRELDDPSDGKIFVVNLGGQVVAKRVQVTGRDKIDLISDNKLYPIVRLGPQSRIIGRVVWFGRKLI